MPKSATTHNPQSGREVELLAAIVAEPDDDALRLTYADWLNERGHSVQAAFVRDSIALGRMRKRAKERDELEAKVDQVGHDHEVWWAWLRRLGLRKRKGVSVFFRRGVVDEISVGNSALKPFHTDAEIMFRLFPITRLRLYSDGKEEAVELLRVLQRLGGLPTVSRNLSLEVTVSEGEVGSSEVSSLAQYAAFCRLTELTLNRSELAIDAVRALVTSPQFVHLNGLCLEYCGLTDATVAALTNSPVFTRLRTLSLAANDIGRKGVRSLAGCRALARLTRLVLAQNPLDGEAIKAVLESPNLARVEHLIISWGEFSAHWYKKLRDRFGEYGVFFVDPNDPQW